MIRMADINDLFCEFDDNIKLTKSKEDSLRKSRNALRKEIKSWFSYKKKNQPKFCGQGSFAMRTTVNPIDGNEYDIDDGVYLQGYSDDDPDEYPAPFTVHTWIKSAVEGHTNKTIDKDTCVRVVYADDHHIDYPIYIYNNWEEVPYLAHKNKGWTKSDPKALTDWFRDKVKDNGEQLRRIVRYIKAWKDYSGIPLKGIEITVLAAENIDVYEGRDEKGLYTTVNEILTELSNNFTCIKPADPYDDLFLAKSESDKKRIMDGLTDLRDSLADAIVCTSRRDASLKMRELFGDRFPLGEDPKDGDSEDCYERTSMPGVLRHDGRSA